MSQPVDIYVYEFGTTTNINFDYKLYKRNAAKSYRPGESQNIPYDLKSFPNSPPVDVDHTFVEDDTNVSSPHTLTLNEDESYYLVIWKDGYIHEFRRFYIAKNDSINTTVLPNPLFFELRRSSSNASLFA